MGILTTMCNLRTRRRAGLLAAAVFLVAALATAQDKDAFTPMALDAGFGSYPQFHRVFTQLMGRSPRSFVQGKDQAP